jgi:hypothetical protein
MRIRSVLLPAFALLPVVLNAATVEMAGEAGVGRTDNIARVATGEQSETITSVGLQFSVLEQSRRLKADITGDLAWLKYANHTYNAELVGNVGAALKLGLVEDRLSWSIEDNFGQTRRDLFAVETPANRENVNYASTGPNLRLGLGGSLDLMAQARYALVDYEKSPLDSRRASGLIGLEHQLSSASHVGLNLARERIEAHGTATFATYTRSQAYLNYATKGARTTATFDVGASRIAQASAHDSGLLLHLALSREIGLSTFTLKLAREFTDAGSSLQLSDTFLLPAANLNTHSLTATADPYVSRNVELGWRITGRRTMLGLAARVFDEDHGGGTPDRRRSGLGAEASRELGTRLRANAGIQFTRNNYRNFSGDQDETSSHLALSWQPGRRLSLEVAGDHSSYSSELPGFSSRETRYWLRLRYGDRITRAPQPL